ncbi:YhzD family protein [Sporosarcina thermotolerans]|uniref:YhzD family protein n=1 Tax=Sporosarcina thermotolerans TaxID=633404 RepID=UPI0036D3E6AC
MEKTFKGMNGLGTYKLTAYEKNGELITEETFTAENDDLAKEKGLAMLTDKNLLEQTHRLASPAGKLLLFHS